MPDDEHDDELGPIDLVALEFPDGQVSSAGFELLVDLVDRGVIGILDVEFVAKGADGSVARVAADTVAHDADFDPSVWVGASSGLLDDDDIADLGNSIGPGGLAVVVVFENRWVLGLVDAWRSRGARLIAEGGIPAADVVAALDAAEAR